MIAELIFWSKSGKGDEEVYNASVVSNIVWLDESIVVGTANGISLILSVIEWTYSIIILIFNFF